MTMTKMQIDREITYFRAKYPEYDDWFMDTPNGIRNVSADLFEAGWISDAERMDSLADEWESLLDETI